MEMKTYWLILAWILVCCFPGYGQRQQQQQQTDQQLLNRAQKALSDIIVHDVFSPPVASRIFLYANLGAYEIAVKANPHYRSLQGQMNDFGGVSGSGRSDINYNIAAVYAFMQIGKKLVFSDDMASDSLTVLLNAFKARGVKKEVIQAAEEYGQKVADEIILYAMKDNYAETRKLRRYSIIKNEGFWQPTPPGYMAAIEPYWNKIRPAALLAPDQFKIDTPVRYSKDKNSDFYRSANEVYMAVNQLNDDQLLIARFWDCNPFALRTNGHMNFAIKKISPGAHWLSIAGIASRAKKADFALTAAAYMYTSLAIFDAFISCWDEKYRSNYIRPETYINAQIDEQWKPLLQTPPFPEYPSGHSVVSSAAAVVLTDLFGDNLSFLDDTEIEYGLPVRKFNSFNEAANEAAISRLYGGIHYKASIENGQKQGKEIGQYILKKIKIRD